MQRALLFGLIAGVAIPLGLAAYQISPSSFHIAIIDGEGAMNNIQGRVAQEPIVQVEDENHKPVRGAYVTFSSPKEGAGVTFSGGTNTLTVATDELGQAVAHGLTTNGVAGNFAINVHVTYQGQTVGDTAIHENNVTGKVADLGRNLDTGGVGADNGMDGENMGPGVLGIVMGPMFELNGSNVPDNANLTANAQVTSLDKTVRVHMKGHCDYLLAPHSQAQIEDHKLILEHGKVRARHNGSCKVAAGFFLISGDPGADGVIAYSGSNVEVASLEGTLTVSSSQGALAGMVAPGAYSSFGGGLQAGASGASAGGASGATASTGAGTATSAKTLAIYSGALGAALAGLGLAVDAILQPGSKSTSP